MLALFFVLAVVTATPAVTAPAATPAVPAFGPHVIYGFVRSVAASSIVIQRHGGQLFSVDIGYARSAGRTGPIYVGRPVAIYGTYDREMHFHANAVTSENGLRNGIWPSDS